jgi:hypothetical protein
MKHQRWCAPSAARLLAAAALAALPLPCHSSIDFYISPQGDDSRGGTTPAQAWRSPGRAAAAVAFLPRPLVDDVVVHVASGSYFLSETLILATLEGGDAQHSVTWLGPDDGSTAILSAGWPVPGPWVPVAGATGVFTAPVVDANGAGASTFVRRMYSTNASDPTLVRSLASTPIMAYASVETNVSQVVLQPGQLPQPPSALADAFLVLWHAWATSINHIIAWNPANNTISAAGPLGDHYNPLSGSFNRYAIQNIADVASLAPGEFIFSPANGSATYRALPGENPAAWPSGYLIAESLPIVVDVKSSTNIAFVNISFRHSAAALEQQCLSQGCGAQSASNLNLAAIMVRPGSSNIQFESCDFSSTGGYALRVETGTSDVSVVGCSFADLGAGGVFAGTPPAAPAAAAAAATVAEGDVSSAATIRFAVTDSTFIRGGQVLPAAPGILLQYGINSSLLHNEVSYFSNTGIGTGWTWGFSPNPNANITVAYNHIHHIGLNETSDLGCVYNLGTSPGLLVDHNLCHDVAGATYGSWGLYMDEGTSDSVWSNNIVHSTKSAGLHIHYGVNNVVLNNVLALDTAFPCDPGAYYCEGAAVLADPGGDQNTSWSFHRNIVYLGTNPNATVLLARERYAFESLNASIDSNIYWAPNVSDPLNALWFNNATFAQWQATKLPLPAGGQPDAHSLVADPLFLNATSGDFSHMDPSSPAITQLGFVPIDISTVGPRPPHQRRRR